MKYGTGAYFGLNVNKQIDIALKTMHDNGGSAKMKDIIANVQKEIYPNRLCAQGKRTLSYCVSKQAVEKGLVHKHDPSKRSQWFITEKGTKLVDSKNRPVVVNESNKNKTTVKKRKTVKKETPQVKIVEREVVKPEKIVIENKQDNKLLIGSLIITNLVILMLALSSMF